MKHLVPVSAVIALFLSLTPRLSAQEVTSQPVPKEPEYEAFEFTEKELPQYDRSDLALLVQYPPEARAAGIEGTVTLRFVVSSKGRAEDIMSIEPADAMLR